MAVRPAAPQRLEIDTPAGPAWVDLDRVTGPRLLIIGHGAGGSVESPDLLSTRRHCLAAGISVARVTQPYRVAGKKAPPAAGTLDAAWSAVTEALARRRGLTGLSVTYAGRSSGARVACRAATAAHEQGWRRPPDSVVCLAFPLHPPGRPDKSRLSELEPVPVPVLIVQGSSDPFGMPPDGTGRTVTAVPGDHGLKASAGRAGELIAQWLSERP